MELWDANKVAEFLKVEPRTVLEKYQARPDFPKAYRISKKKLRWDSDEIINFVKSCR